MFPLKKVLVALMILKLTRSDEIKSYKKCCEYESILNDRFECTKIFPDNFENETILEILPNNSKSVNTICLKGAATGPRTTDVNENDGNFCVDTFVNGTEVTLDCDSVSIISNDTSQTCGNIFTQLHFWGATIVIFATLIYNIPFIVVVIIYNVLPELRYRAYDRAVNNYYFCYMTINFILITLGFLTLCDSKLSDTAYRLFGLSLMFLTQGSVIWLFIICFDMTLVITRFRWAPKGGVERGKEEKRKCLIYAAWGWGCSIVLTLIAAIVELTPIFPEDSPIRPNFQNFDSLNIAVVVWVITGPVVACSLNTCLFIYTTVKTIIVQKSTAVVNENRKTNVRKRYFVFLKLYLLMDTPWLTGALGAIYPDMWVLKFIKMIQPILIIILIVPRKRILEGMNCCRGESSEREMTRLNNKSPEKEIHASKKTEKV